MLGSSFVTINGAIAEDVHGKNHEKEVSCDDHVDAITLLTPEGMMTKCDKDKNKEVFQ